MLASASRVDPNRTEDGPPRSPFDTNSEAPGGDGGRGNEVEVVPPRRLLLVNSSTLVIKENIGV